MEFDLQKISENDQAEISKALALNAGGDNSRVDSKEEYEKLGELLSGAAKGSETAKCIEQLMFDGLESTLVSPAVREAVAGIVKYGDDTKADMENEIAALKKLKKTKGLSEFDKLYIEKIIKGHEITKSGLLSEFVQTPAKPQEGENGKPEEKKKNKFDGLSDEPNVEEAAKKTEEPKTNGRTDEPRTPINRKRPKIGEEPSIADRKKGESETVNSNNGNGNTVVGNGTRTGEGGTTVVIDGSGNTVNIGTNTDKNSEDTHEDDGINADTKKKPLKPSDDCTKEGEKIGSKIADDLMGYTSDAKWENVQLLVQNRVTEDNIYGVIKGYTEKEGLLTDLILEQIYTEWGRTAEEKMVLIENIVDKVIAYGKKYPNEVNSDSYKKLVEKYNKIKGTCFEKDNCREIDHLILRTLKINH